MKDNFKSCIPALVIILALYVLAGTADYATQQEVAQAAK
jgi:hypothetical protein